MYCFMFPSDSVTFVFFAGKESSWALWQSVQQHFQGNKCANNKALSVKDVIMSTCLCQGPI